jgi:hypothetical protein
VQQLLADIESPRYAVRERATRHLERLADRVGTEVANALKATKSEETRVRLEKVVATAPSAERPLAAWAAALNRAVAVVERAGTAEARLLLMAWAGGTPNAFLTREATAALGRMESQR